MAGRYRLDALLGEGGMGVVWSASHVVTKKRVALKILKLDGTSETQRRRFIREARASCAVRHPNVREVYDVLEAEAGSPALVMELLEGESLARLLAREGTLTLERASELLLPVVSAVGAAHTAGIVHRDIKPENVFLAEGARAGPRVLDFGIAKVREPGADASASLSTETGTLMGTPAYMSPEQVFGERDVDHRADVWALGLVLYRCLSGVLPTHGENVGQIMKNIVARPIPPIETLAPELPDDVRRVVRKMLSRERDRRPALEAVAAVLERHTSVRAPTFGPPAVRAARGAADQTGAGAEGLAEESTELGASAGMTTEVPELSERPERSEAPFASPTGHTFSHATTVESPASEPSAALARSHTSSAAGPAPRTPARRALALAAIVGSAVAVAFVAREASLAARTAASPSSVGPASAQSVTAPATMSTLSTLEAGATGSEGSDGARGSTAPAATASAAASTTAPASSSGAPTTPLLATSSVPPPQARAPAGAPQATPPARGRAPVAPGDKIPPASSAFSPSENFE